MPDDEEWRILAEEAAQEKDPNKLLEIVNALNAAIDNSSNVRRKLSLTLDRFSQNVPK